MVMCPVGALSILTLTTLRESRLHKILVSQTRRSQNKKIWDPQKNLGSTRQSGSFGFGGTEGKRMNVRRASSSCCSPPRCGDPAAISSMPSIVYRVGRRSYLLVDDVGQIQPTEDRSIQEPEWMDIGRPLHCTPAFPGLQAFQSTRPSSVPVM